MTQPFIRPVELHETGEFAPHGTFVRSCGLKKLVSLTSVPVAEQSPSLQGARRESAHTLPSARKKGEYLPAAPVRMPFSRLRAPSFLLLLLGFSGHGGGTLELILDAPRDTVWSGPALQGLAGDVGLHVRLRVSVGPGDSDLSQWAFGVAVLRDSTPVDNNTQVPLKAHDMSVADACQLIRDVDVDRHDSDASGRGKGSVGKVYECYHYLWLRGCGPGCAAHARYTSSTAPSPLTCTNGSGVKASAIGLWKITVFARHSQHLAVLPILVPHAHEITRLFEVVSPPAASAANEEEGGGGVPLCWHAGKAVGEQTDECLWVWRRFEPYRQIWYTREEYMRALETFDVRGFGTEERATLEALACALPPQCGPLSRLERKHRQEAGVLGTCAADTSLGSCAVVGNSWILLHGTFGPEIDSHDAVFRLNDAPIDKDLLVHTGRRTTHRVLELSAMKNSPDYQYLFPGQVQLLRLTPATRSAVTEVLQMYASSYGMHVSSSSYGMHVSSASYDMHVSSSSYDMHVSYSSNDMHASYSSYDRSCKCMPGEPPRWGKIACSWSLPLLSTTYRPSSWAMWDGPRTSPQEWWR